MCLPYELIKQISVFMVGADRAVMGWIKNNHEAFVIEILLLLRAAQALNSLLELAVSRTENSNHEASVLSALPLLLKITPAEEI